MVEMTFTRKPDGSVTFKPTGKTAKAIDEALAPKRDLTWLEPIGLADRCDQLNRLDATLIGADCIAAALGQTTVDYGACIANLRRNIRAERQKLLKELEAEALQNQQDRAQGLYGDGMCMGRMGE